MMSHQFILVCQLIIFLSHEAHYPNVCEDAIKMVEVESDHPSEKSIVEVRFWDTGGDVDYDRIRVLSYPETDLFMIIYSVERPESLEKVKTRWVHEIQAYCPGIPYILIGNKIDLRDSNVDPKDKYYHKLLPASKGEEMAKEIDAAAFFECSALTRVGLDEMFIEAVRIAAKIRATEERHGHHKHNHPNSEKCALQ